ncbi:hypothetical protein [Streptacidiphilus melanogenes]|uniref:hypothetical protein n=1 Tax=Streptacidiphilus melanogenes TaxID=411235 RepID=UPI000AED61B8|nr:hypothetical protein [Streptacidiphilus melanogenes]
MNHDRHDMDRHDMDQHGMDQHGMDQRRMNHDEVPPPAFRALMAEVTADGQRFGHRQHVELTWLAVRRHGASHAAELVGEGIRRTATAAGAPQKFHVTMTRAWVELVAHHLTADAGPSDDFDTFAARHPELLDKALLSRFYRPETLAGAAARVTWVAPDLAPFPWQHA